MIMDRMGLYDPANEHDACGVGLVADISGVRDRRIVEYGLQITENMAHRGAENADGRSGDGAGIMTQVPHEFIVSQGIPVPEAGRYGTGIIFLPKDSAEDCMSFFREKVGEEGLQIIAERDVPVRSGVPGDMAKAREPKIVQVFITSYDSQELLEHKLFRVRKITSNALAGKEDFYICSLSTRVIVYKGMLTPAQLRQYYPDLSDPNFKSAIAMVHSRFSTNTMPSWKLAQPFRMLCHNGEINTIKGNRAWMKARESVMESKWFDDISRLYPIVQDGMSDSASLDNVAEFMTMSGKSMEHCLSMLIPESWNDTNPIPDDLKAFYEYHSILMEPWDGPAAVLFTDGRIAGGMLDRNGLRPARYTITNDGLMILASEAGVVDIRDSNVKEKGRLRPGKMIIVDTEKGKIVRDSEIKQGLASAYPYREWLEKNRVELDSVRSGREPGRTVQDLDTMMNMFGYTEEDISTMLPMAADSKEPTGSMGNDTPMAILSERPQRLFNYFRQSFAQVTNPPIDPIREELVMSITGYVGSIHWNILDPMPEHSKAVKIRHPVITNREMDLIRNLDYKGFKTSEIPMTFPAGSGHDGMLNSIDEMCRQAEDAVDEGASYIIITDRGTDEKNVPIPSLLAVSAVHQHLIEKRKRVQTAIVVESGEPRDVMHFALLFGYGANAVNPYLAFALIEDLANSDRIRMDAGTAESNYVAAAEKGLLKIMSKMGIATLRSYRGAYLFEALGLGREVTEKYFAGTVSNIGGIGFREICHEASAPHASAYSEQAPDAGKARHSWNAASVRELQRAVRENDPCSYRKFADMQDGGRFFIRDVMEISAPSKIPISDVESAESIMRRFSTGAVSFGSISREAHVTFAEAMNAIGGQSNTGEGGEDPERFSDDRRSSIKQVASGRFGVTAEYLVNADEIQIKVAQGAKPGEGGQLMGFKVDDVIAKTRHTLPGITLISPPPHHDIYSIEDLAQLIFDMRCINPSARISVKLVSESGVGTVAAGVAKAGADLILISGGDGGTGASPVSSVKFAGMPWELGLAEAQQTLVMSGLRERVRLQVDGQMKTGRDVIISALLGAEEYSFTTAPMVAIGCIMDRKCHTNTCPVGIATQDPAKRKKYRGCRDNVVNYFRFVAEDVREHMAEMGFRSLSDMIGRADLISKKETDGKAAYIDISRITATVKGTLMHRVMQPDPAADVLDKRIIKDAEPALSNGRPVKLRYGIRNTDRSVGTMLSGEIARRKKELCDGAIGIEFEGSAGQSFGAFLIKGVDLVLKGESNDYVGKGLSGGRISIIPDGNDGNVIAGNTILYGATSGEAYIRGAVGERFCVRNSGAVAVAEGIGDHGCEYMTGGRAVILGPTGRNFAAGMSGGIAYVLNEDGDLDRHCNMDMIELSLVEGEDAEELRSILKDHAEHTGSPKAKGLLDDWNESKKGFLKVMPIGLKEVLRKTAPE